MKTFDVIIVGGGFAGSLLAYVLASNGMRVALIDDTVHPRFAVGESSTPIADLLIKVIADKYQLESLLPFSRYGAWKKQRPEVMCGKKRGFSYFSHQPHHAFQESDRHENSMLVTASLNDDLADTHWVRADVDHYFFRLAEEVCAEVLLGHVHSAEESENGWRLGVTLGPNSNANLEVKGSFLIDAGGRNGTLKQAFGVYDVSDRLLTNTCSTFGHFVNVQPMTQWLQQHQINTLDHPFDCDDAAQHHLLGDNGWLWMLRMDDGRVSVGWTRRAEPACQIENMGVMRALGIDAYPTLCEMFRHSQLIAPSTGLISTARLQRCASRIVGNRYALMPTAAVVIDPLHSSGIAHGLSGVYRLASHLLASQSQSDQSLRLQEYQRQVLKETAAMDMMVAGCNESIGCFELFCAHAMIYFVAAIHSEEAIAAGRVDECLWSADDAGLMRLLQESYLRIRNLMWRPRMEASAVPAREIEAYLEWMRDAIGPWNHYGLMDQGSRNRYHYTAAPKGDCVP